MRKTFTKLTLIVFAFAMVGLSAQTSFAGEALIIIVNVNGAGVGFNDPTPAAPVGGNTGTTLGQQRLIAFQHAANLWGARLDSNPSAQCTPWSHCCASTVRSPTSIVLPAAIERPRFAVDVLPRVASVLIPGAPST